jgi:hypothetical protein
MSALVLDETQVKAVLEAEGNVPVRDASGRELGTLVRADVSAKEQIQLSPEELDQLLERMSMRDAEWKTTGQVLDELQEFAPVQ